MSITSSRPNFSYLLIELHVVVRHVDVAIFGGGWQAAIEQFLFFSARFHGKGSKYVLCSHLFDDGQRCRILPSTSKVQRSNQKSNQKSKGPIKSPSNSQKDQSQVERTSRKLNQKSEGLMKSRKNKPGFNN